MPKIVIPAFIRTILFTHVSSGGAAAVSPDFTGTTLATIIGGTTGVPVPFKCAVEKLRLHVSSVDGAGASATQTYKLRKGAADGTVLATLTVALAAALRGVTLTAAVAAADDAAAHLVDGDLLFVTRESGGTVFSTLEGVFDVVARQPNQAKF